MIERFFGVHFVVEAKSDKRDGDGDGLYTATRGGRDVTPVPVAQIADAANELYKRFTDSDAAEEYGKKWELWREGLPPEQLSALKNYTNMDYEMINKSMRLNRSGPKLEPVAKIQAALDDSEIPEPLRTIRYIDPYVLDNLEEGDVLDDLGFQSTSLTGGYYWPGLARLEIDVPAGAKGAYLGDEFSKVKGETELLLPPSSYEIMELMTGDDGAPVARVRLIAQNDEWFEIDDNGRVVKDAAETKVLPTIENLEFKADARKGAKPPRGAERFVTRAKDIKVIRAAQAAAYRTALARYRK